jgi:hypothetical protein
MKTIFKEGDRVFCYNQGGWGNVIKIFSDDNPYPIYCSFDLGNSNFTKDGRFYADGPPILSFTEYTLEGFSQDRPEPAPKPGDIVWVRDTEYDSWMITYFRRFSTDAKLRYGTNAKNSDNSQYIYYYRFLTTKNPYANE